MITISKQYSFDSSHQLWNNNQVGEWNHATFGKCARMHGHTYTLEVEVTGEVSKYDGMIMNYFDLDDIVKPIVDGELDHQHLNDVFHPTLTTAENMVGLIAERIRVAFVATPFGSYITVRKVTLSETPKTKAVWHASV